MSDDLERTILQAFPPQPLGKAAKELRHLAGTTDPAAKLEFVVSPGGDGRQLISSGASNLWKWKQARKTSDRRLTSSYNIKLARLRTVRECL